MGKNLPWYRQQGDWSVVTAIRLWAFSFTETDDNAVPPFAGHKTRSPHLYKQRVECSSNWAKSALEKFRRNTVGAWSTALFLNFLIAQTTSSSIGSLTLASGEGAADADSETSEVSTGGWFSCSMNTLYCLKMQGHHNVILNQVLIMTSKTRAWFKYWRSMYFPRLIISLTLPYSSSIPWLFLELILILQLF